MGFDRGFTGSITLLERPYELGRFFPDYKCLSWGYKLFGSTGRLGFCFWALVCCSRFKILDQGLASFLRVMAPKLSLKLTPKSSQRGRKNDKALAIAAIT